MAPDLRKKVDAMRAARLAREAEMKKQVDAQVSPLSRCVLVHPFSFGFVASKMRGTASPLRFENTCAAYGVSQSIGVVLVLDHVFLSMLSVVLVGAEIRHRRFANMHVHG